jgi:peptide/nickel transport system permease protein
VWGPGIFPVRHLLSYVITRVLLAIPMIFIMLTIVFVVLRIMPGDPVSAMLGGQAPQRVIDQKKEELGLNKPVVVQYVDYLGQLARFDLGKSMIFNQPVGQPIIEKLPATLELTLFGLIASIGIGIPLGAASARRRRSGGDVAARLYASIVYCIPVFWMGLMLQLVFGVWLRWFPVAGRTGARVDVSSFSWSGFYLLDTLRAGNIGAFADVLWHLVLPALTLGIVLSGIFVRLTRANMLDVLKTDYILAARARGIPERRVVYNHGLRNALVPIVTMLGLQFSLLLAGAILTESTFSWPGMGRLLLERISLRDYPVIQGTIVVYTLFVSIVSLLVDLLYAVIDPRVKY